MRGHLLVVLVATVGCGESQLGPFQPLPIDTQFVDIEGLDDVVHIARDRFGIAHVWAKSYGDLGYGQGYAMAHDRLVQMDTLRRFASGTLAEVYGGNVDPAVVDAIVQLDREMRFHRLRVYAQKAWDDVQQTDPVLAEMMQRYADGVNAYVSDITNGKWRIDPAIDSASELYPLFAPTQFTDWDPVDSFVIMNYFTFAQSWTVPEEIELTDLEQRLRATYGASIARDMLAFAPIAESTIAAPPPPMTLDVRPDASLIPGLITGARALLSRPVQTDPRLPVGAHAYMRPFLGSNAFVVGLDYTRQLIDWPKAILAADMQTTLTNPSPFYPMHQIVGSTLLSDPPIHDVIGLMLPGVPIVIAGTNGYIGWAPTVGTHDVNDVYLETLAAGGTVSVHGTTMETIVREQDEIRIGDYGNITGGLPITHETIPRHGPIIPGHPPDKALAIRYTGYANTPELAILWAVAAQFNVEGARGTLSNAKHGPGYVLIDQVGAYAWTTAVDVPDRDPAAMSYSSASPAASAPFFILDGSRGDHEWRTAFVSQDFLPSQSVNDAFIALADGDLIGGTRDADPLNGRYFGVAYANGLRDTQLAKLITTATIPVDEEAIANMQHDVQSTFGALLAPEIVKILNNGATGAPGDVATYLAGLTPAQVSRIAVAEDVLRNWTSFDTPIASVSADANSAATLLFNTWMHYFAKLALDDELAGAGYPKKLDDDRIARIVHRLLLDPTAMTPNGASGQPMLCAIQNAGNQSCTKLVIEAALLAADDLMARFGGRDDWRWGREHALKMRMANPDPLERLLLPRKMENETGFQIPGDMFVIDRTDGGWDDLAFSPRIGVAYRMVLGSTPRGEPLTMKLELSTGAVLDSRDPHYRDLLERSYLTRTHFDVPIRIKDINDNGESRWEFR